MVDAADALATSPWLAVAELGGGEARDRILLAARLDEAELRDAFAGRLEREERLESGPNGLRAKETLRLGRLVLEERLIANPPPALIEAALKDEVRRRGLAALSGAGEGFETLRRRVGFLRGADPVWPDLSDDALVARLDDWLAPLLAGRRSLADLGDGALADALRTLIPWDLQRRLDAEAPARWTAPTGNSFRIDYAAEGGPRVEVRVQELFGLASHPTAAGTPLTLALLSPAHRPIQLTRDLPGFWKGSWSDVRKDMRGRYPKHPWPEDPATAMPTTRAKPRGGK
jgi:ATP-dependent helicase HrpB